MIIIEDKTKEAIVYIPKTGKAQEPKPSEMTLPKMVYMRLLVDIISM